MAADILVTFQNIYRSLLFLVRVESKLYKDVYLIEIGHSNQKLC